MSNSLSPDQARRFVGPDLGPNCWPRLSADDTGRQRVKGTERKGPVTCACISRGTSTSKEKPGKPGPADHDVKHSNLKKSPLYSCRQRVKHSYPDSVTYARVETEGPGPGAYKTVDSFLNNDKPAFSFRKRLKDRAEAEKEIVPGPNVYNAESCNKPESKKAPAFSMAKRLKGPNSMQDTPGPGEYSPKLKSSAPKYTMTTRPQRKGTFVNPAPNRYTLPEAIASKNKGVVFKSRASPYVYSGFRATKLMEPSTLPEISA